MSKDYYHILGLDKKASKEEVKKAFRTMAHKYHPDKKDGDEAKFKEVNEAYSILSDEKKRAEYDTYGRVFNGGNGGGAQGGFNAQDFGGFDFSQFSQGANGNGFEFDLGDIFGDFFGGGGRREVKRGRDISIDIEVSFEDAIFGVARDILLTKTSRCDTCTGTGAKPGTDMKTCATCNGNGKIHETKRSFLGVFTQVRACHECHGRGQVPKEKCSECKGAGVYKKEEEISIKIPAGMDNGEMIRLSGMGEAIPDGASGDLYIKVHVKRHSTFRKVGNNLEMDLGVKLSSALLGEEYVLKTLDGDITIKIPQGVTHGEILKVKGKGVPYDKTRRGDLMIHINIQLPHKLSKAAHKLIEELKKEGI